MEKSDDMVMLSLYYDAVSANIDKGVLATNGIESFLTNERTGTILTGLCFAEIRLMVMRKDYEAALKILDSSEVSEAENHE